MPIEFSELLDREQRPKSRKYLLRLTKAMKSRIEHLATKENKPMSFVIREMLDEGLDRRE